MSAEKVALLCQSPLFEMLRDRELNFLAGIGDELSREEGHVLFEEGEVGDRLYVLTSGDVEVTRKDRNGAAHRLAVLSAFSFFGEMGVLGETSRSATVRALGPVRLFAFTAEDLTTFRGAYPDGYLFLVHNLARELAVRLRETSARLVEKGAGTFSPEIPR